MKQSRASLRNHALLRLLGTTVAYPDELNFFKREFPPSEVPRLEPLGGHRRSLKGWMAKTLAVQVAKIRAFQIATTDGIGLKREIAWIWSEFSTVSRADREGTAVG